VCADGRHRRAHYQPSLLRRFHTACFYRLDANAWPQGDGGSTADIETPRSIYLKSPAEQRGSDVHRLANGSEQHLVLLRPVPEDSAAYGGEAVLSSRNPSVDSALGTAGHYRRRFFADPALGRQRPSSVSNREDPGSPERDGRGRQPGRFTTSCSRSRQHRLDGGIFSAVSVDVLRPRIPTISRHDRPLFTDGAAGQWRRASSLSRCRFREFFGSNGGAARTRLTLIACRRHVDSRICSLPERGLIDRGRPALINARGSSRTLTAHTGAQEHPALLIGPRLLPRHPAWGREGPSWVAVAVPRPVRRERHTGVEKPAGKPFAGKFTARRYSFRTCPALAEPPGRCLAETTALRARLVLIRTDDVFDRPHPYAAGLSKKEKGPPSAVRALHQASLLTAGNT